MLRLSEQSLGQTSGEPLDPALGSLTAGRSGADDDLVGGREHFGVE